MIFDVMLRQGNASPHSLDQPVGRRSRSARRSFDSHSLYARRKPGKTKASQFAPLANDVEMGPIMAPR